MGMKRTFKKSLALFLSAALLLSNSLVTAADSSRPAGTPVENTGGGTKELVTSAGITETERDDNESTDATIGKDVQGENPNENKTEQETDSEDDETVKNEEDLNGTGSGSDVKEDVTGTGPEDGPGDDSEESPSGTDDVTEDGSEDEAGDEDKEGTPEEDIESDDVTADDQEKTETEATDDETSEGEETVTEDEDIEEAVEEDEAGIYKINTTLIPEKGGVIEVANEIAEGDDLEFTVTVKEGYLPEYVEVDGESIDPVDFDENEYTFFFNVKNIISETGVIEIEAGFASMTDANLNMSLFAESIEIRDIDSSKVARTFSLMPGDSIGLYGAKSYDESDIFPLEANGTHCWTILDESGNELDNKDGLITECDSGENYEISIERDISEINPELVGKKIYVKHDYIPVEWVVDYIIIGHWELKEPDYELFEITIENPKQSAYFYIKKAEFAVGSGSSEAAGTNSENYEYWGTGSVPLLSAGNMVQEIGLDRKRSLDDFKWTEYDNLFEVPDEPQGTPDIMYQDEDWTEARRIMDSEGYPILYLDNSDGTYTAYYHEDSNDQEKGTNVYSIEWSVISIARGALGDDHKTRLTNDEYTYHIDGEVSLRNEDSIELNASWQKTAEAGNDPDFADETKYSSKSIMIPIEGDASKVWEEFRAGLDINVPERYELAWYFDKAGTEAYDPDTLNKLAQEEGTKRINLFGIFVSDKINPDRHTLTYYANNDTDAAKSQELEEGKVTLDKTSNGFTYGTNIFLGWSLTENALITSIDAQNDAGIIIEIDLDDNKDVYAVWAQDSDGDEKPDYEEIKVIFKIKEADRAYGKIIDGDTDYSDIQYISGDEKASAPEVEDTLNDTMAFVGWYKDGDIAQPFNADNSISEESVFYAVFESDNIPNSQEITIKFESDYGFVAAPDKTEVVTIQKPGDQLAAPTPVDTETDGVIWTGWTNGTDDYTKDAFTEFKVPETAATYIALYADDKNNNGQPDDTEPAAASITPYNTHIYVGGTNDYGEAGLPNLELELKAGEVKRPVEEENVQSIFINGVAQPVENGNTIYTFLRAVYVDDSGNVITDDAQHDAVSTTGTYNIEVALTSDVLTANEEAGIETAAAGDETDTGYLMGADGRPVLARQSTVIINNNKIDFGSSKEDAAQLVVRSVSDTEAARSGEIYRAIYTEEGTVAEGRAIAVIDPSTTYYTNNIEDGRVIDDPSGIRLMVDDVLAPTENDGAERTKLLKEKANAALPELNGMTAEEAEAAGYHYVLRYMDLVDSNNGNAWVSSSTGTDVYVPYQTADGSETEYRIIHFKDLHREYGLIGSNVVDAINQGSVEIMDIENTPYGIKFHTDAAGFSPFAIIWNENGNFDGTSDDEQGGDTPGGDEEQGGTSGDIDNTGDAGNTGNTGTGTGSAGGHNESDRNSTGGTYYTAGVNGNWRHMDNVDVNAPLDEAVPQVATAMAAPEWHRWKFFRNDGSNIRGQWAHIANPYAADDQPKTGWFYFDAEGLMQYGWFLDTTTGKWYYLHAESDGMLGTMITGWHYDLGDGRWYYLDPATGEMLLGWQNIGGKWYYFNTTPNEQTWNLDSLAGLWRFNNSTARPLGSMYVDETTPDGYQVDGSGAWIR